MSLPVFSLKSYQTQTLAQLRDYLAKAVELADADTAFYKQTGRTYCNPPALPALPYVCLRIPTGGGKTILAAHSIAVAADHFLQTDTPTVLWLVPSQTIREQTLASLSNREHPNRRALADRFGENVRIMTVSDALYAKRADYDGGAVVIVATIQAFRVEEKEGRKVYEANGELMDHFTGLAQPLRAKLENSPSGNPLPSLANVLRLRRPMVIVDEAHNVRTELSFDTLAKLSPSLVIELTATPVTPDEQRIEKGNYASNVLHHVSAAELKAEDMIKLPVILRGRSDPKDTLADAIAWLDELSDTARKEHQATGEYTRPVMLVQAEAKSKDKDTLHAERVKTMLVEDFRIPEAHVAIATGDSKGLEGVDLFNPDCQLRFIITQQALKEGWDCSFAYVLCSVAEQRSPRAVEQLLGRVLRLPYAKRKRHEDLNRAYAFATTTSFQNAATTLRDGLVSNGFDKIEAKALVHSSDTVLRGMEDGGAAYVYEETLPDSLDVSAYQSTIAAITGGRVTLDPVKRTIEARGALNDYDLRNIQMAMPDHTEMVARFVLKTRNVRFNAPDIGQDYVRFAVPMLCVNKRNQPELFDRAHFLDIPWPLEESAPETILDHFTPPNTIADGALIDVDAVQGLKLRFVTDLHEQLSLALTERGWTRPALINWLDRRLPISARRDIMRVSSTLFIDKVLDTIGKQYAMDLDALARAKFLIVKALVSTIAQLREARQNVSFKQALIPQSGLEFATSSAVELVFEQSRYSYDQPYDPKTEFNKHYFDVIGDLKEDGEEHDCAITIDRHPKIKKWVRNTAKDHSFWLQTATGRFYPDFVALLQDGRVAVIEYKGAHIDDNEIARQKRLIGKCWADHSNGQCLFIWIADRQFSQLDQALA